MLILVLVLVLASLVLVLVKTCPCQVLVLVLVGLVLVIVLAGPVLRQVLFLNLAHNTHSIVLIVIYLFSVMVLVLQSYVVNFLGMYLSFNSVNV